MMTEKTSMNEILSQEGRLKLFLKEQVRQNLLAIGRKLVVEKGPNFLTARKLSEASSCSVGTIYNQFANMENFINQENAQTLDELYVMLQKIMQDSNPYVNINRYVDVFSNFVIVNTNLWNLLFDAHLQGQHSFPLYYNKKVRRIERMFEAELSKMFGSLAYAERHLAAQVLEMSVFALSGFLASDAFANSRLMNKNNICKLLLNTYLAGFASLKKG